MVALADNLKDIGLTRHDAWLLRSLASSVRPRPRVRTSEWAEANVRLTEDQAAREGPFRCDWKPWTRAIHDLTFDEPGKLGLIAVKAGQIGFSRAVMNIVGCIIDTDPGPTLYMTTDDEQAKRFANEEFAPMVRTHARLRGLVRQASDQGRREQMHSFPFPGGRLDFVGAGSESKLVGKPYRRVIIDEYDTVCDNYPGDPWTAAGVRTATFRGESLRFAFGHPRLAGEGIEKLWEDESDQREWSFLCPHCAAPIFPRWSLVRFSGTIGDETDGTAAIDPATATLECPACCKAISDAQRARAVWPAADGRGGGFRSRLTPEEAADRRYIGIRIHRLCDPEVTLAELAVEYASALKAGEKALIEFHGKRLGEGWKSKQAVLDEAAIDQAMADAGKRVLVPGGRLGVRFVTAGFDVQAPRDNPLFYAAAGGFGVNGHIYVTHLDRVRGFAAVNHWLSAVEVPVSEGKPLGISAAGMDDRYESGQVKDWARFANIWAVPSSALVRLVPMGFQASPNLNRDNPVVLRNEHKRTHPTRPELGPIDMYDLHRHSWVDRVLRMFADGRIHILCTAPTDLREHLTSQVLAPKRDPHTNWQEKVLEWDKASNTRRDDWLMAIVYAVAAAAIKCGLDRLHLLDTDAPPPGTLRVVAPRFG